jgi:hypothetical protein
VHSGTPMLGRAEADVTVGPAGTLLAVVPIPGTGTSLAIVGYPVPGSGTAAIGTTVPAGPGTILVAQPDGGRSGLLLDHDQRRVWVDGAEVALTFQEFELLAFLASHPDTVFSRTDPGPRGLAAGLRRHKQDGRRARQPPPAQARPELRQVPGYRVPRRLPVPPRRVVSR